MKQSRFSLTILTLFLFLCIGMAIGYTNDVYAQALNPSPPGEPVKLIFIHHSCGENWLSDSNGGLGIALANNNYFVSDTNYGWGPDSIGDATDYYNWTDWFTGPNSSRYLDALFNENSTNSPYSRSFSDPGGENRIIMFKSCFPNSDLGGNPDDPPSDEEWFTVGHAKYVYNELLSYFATRPDKLFIAITPPPLINSSNAENAREFSRWLVEDWLSENNYTTNNVFVWDFHNILTHPDNHHRINNGGVEYVINHGNGALYYDSDGDDHPNTEGNRKATTEFIPMLNTFYHQWVETAPETAPESGEAETGPETVEEPEEPAPVQEQPVGESMPFGMIDDFESGSPEGTYGWEAYWDEATESTISCGVDSSVARDGTSSLRIDFHVEPDGWATCPLFFENPTGFSNTNGISFDYKSSDAGLLFNLDAYEGSEENRSTYHFIIETVQESIDGWVHYELTWDQIVGVDWEANPGAPVDPNEINGFAFGFNTYTDSPNSGTIWIDNFSLISSDQSPPPAIQEPEAEPAEDTQQEQQEPDSETDEGDVEQQPEAEGEERDRRLCPGSTALVGISLVAVIASKKSRLLKKRD